MGELAARGAAEPAPCAEDVTRVRGDCAALVRRLFDLAAGADAGDGGAGEEGGADGDGGGGGSTEAVLEGLSRMTAAGRLVERMGGPCA